MIKVEFDEAVEAHRTATQINPQSADAFNNLANALDKIGQELMKLFRHTGHAYLY